MLKFFCLPDISLFVALVVLCYPIFAPDAADEVVIVFLDVQHKLAQVFLHVRRFAVCLFDYPLGSHPESCWKK